MKLVTTKTAILIILCVVLVAAVTIIGANWDLISLSQKSTSNQPTTYTWEEFVALTPEEKDVFANSFPSTDDFYQWIDSNTPSTVEETALKLPWENGGKSPEEYTYSEFLTLSTDEQSAFANTFTNADAFTAWQKIAAESDNSLQLPWKNGGKQPAEYSWDEFLALTATEKDLFPLAFPTTNDYHQWLDKVNP